MHEKLISIVIPAFNESENIPKIVVAIENLFEQLPYRYEIIMVADNLGSIPPNTSLMVVTSKLKRYEVFISSSEQKNARVVIERKE